MKFLDIFALAVIAWCVVIAIGFVVVSELLPVVIFK